MIIRKLVRFFFLCVCLFALAVIAANDQASADIWDSPSFSKYSQAADAYNKHDYETARALLEDSLKDYPGNALSLYLLGHTYMRLGQEDRAIQAFEEVLRVYPGVSDIRMTLGALYEDTGNWKEALKNYEEMTLAEPDNPEWPKRMALIAEKNGDTKALENYLRTWLRLEPDNLDAVILLADKLTERQAWKDAAAVLRDHYPQGGDALIATRLAGIYFNNGQFPEAQRWFQELTKLEPKSADHPYRLGYIAYRAGDKEKAAEYFARALALNPQQYGALYNLGVIRTEQKRYEEAIDLFERCAKVNPQATEPYRQLGRIYEQALLDPAKAQEYYRKADAQKK